MPETQVRGPDGQIHTVRHPEGASQQEIIDFAKRSLENAPYVASDVLDKGAEAKPSTMFDRFVGSAEAIGSLGSGMAGALVSSPIAGLAALGDIGLRKAAGYEEASPSKDIIEKYTLKGYTPKTKEGKAALEMVTAPLTKFDQFMYGVGAKTADITGSPVMGAAVKAAPDAALMFAGTKMPKSPLQRIQDISSVEQGAKRLGLELGADTTEQAKQLQAAGESFQPAINPSEGMESIPSAIQQQRALQSKQIGKQFEAAKAAGATLPSRSAATLTDQIKESAAPFVNKNIPTVNELLAESEKFGKPAESSISEALGVKGAAQTPINDIFSYREKINANLPSDYRSPEYAALSKMKRTVDNYLNDQLTKDLVSGDPSAIKQWQSAISNWKDFKQTFDENRVIKKLQDDEATPEQVKNLIFGASAIRAPRQAGNVIDGLKKILGPKSEEFKTLQKSALADVLDPVLQSEPDFVGFLKNYDTFKKNNPTLIAKLFDSETADKLEQLRNFSEAVEKNAPFTTKIADTMKGKGLANLFSVLTAGSGLAKKSLEVNFMRRVFNTLTPDKSAAHRKAIIADVLGYDPYAPMIPFSPVVRESAVQSARGLETPMQLYNYFTGE